MAYLATSGGQPILILKEGTSRRRGREAQRNNIMAARIIAEVLRYAWAAWNGQDAHRQPRRHNNNQ